MKKILVIAMMMVLGTALYAQTYTGGTKDKSATLSTSVITAFNIWDYTPGQGNNPHTQEVVKGQKRTITPSEGCILFEMVKEANYTVRLNLSVPNPVDYVTLTANWYFNDTPPDWSKDFPGVPLNSAWNWYDTQTHGWVTIKVSEIDARNPLVTVGTKVFTAYANGYYIGL